MARIFLLKADHEVDTFHIDIAITQRRGLYCHTFLVLKGKGFQA
jgi:hypothetical protein